MDALPVATRMVERLVAEGFSAYFAGGWVRDYLMGHPSDDIDIATTATPEEVIALFPKTIEVGKAFGIVVVVEEGHQFEVASFRKEGRYLDGRYPESVEPATPEEDAERRDFTINGMFYDPIKKEILDFVDGKADLERKVIRAIGDATQRFKEDRLRIIRGIRFSARFDFDIEEETKAAMRESAPTLYPSVSVERVWHELQRMSGRPGIRRVIRNMFDLGILGVVFPPLVSLPKETLEELIQPLFTLPKEVPAILHYAHLFPSSSSRDCFENLKVSNKELKLLELFEEMRDLGELTKIEWVRLYAHPDCDLILDVLTNLRGAGYRTPHEERKQKLAAHIERMAAKRPLVNSRDLIAAGVEPGKKMGELLRAAEKLVIEEDLSSKEEALELLREQING